MNISLRKTNSNEISERATYRKLGAFCWVLSIQWKISIAFNFPSGINAINFSCIVLLLGNSAVSWLSVNCPRKFSYYLPLFRNIWLNGRRSLVVLCSWILFCIPRVHAVCFCYGAIRKPSVRTQHWTQKNEDKVNCFPFETNFNPEHSRKTYFPWSCLA